MRKEPSCQLPTCTLPFHHAAPRRPAQADLATHWRKDPEARRSRRSTETVAILTAYLFSYSPPHAALDIAQNRLFMRPVVNAHPAQAAILISRYRAHLRLEYRKLKDEVTRGRRHSRGEVAGSQCRSMQLAGRDTASPTGSGSIWPCYASDDPTKPKMRRVLL